MRVLQLLKDIIVFLESVDGIINSLKVDKEGLVLDYSIKLQTPLQYISVTIHI